MPKGYNALLGNALQSDVWHLNLKEDEDEEEEEGKEIPQAKTIKLFGYVVLMVA